MQLRLSVSEINDSALEMIGYYDSTPGSQDYPSPAMSWLYPDRETLLPWSAECRISTPFVR